jgi:hypothetical protein
MIKASDQLYNGIAEAKEHRQSKPFSMPDDVALAWWRVIESIIKKRAEREKAAGAK